MNNLEFLEYLLANFPRAVTALNMRFQEGGGLRSERWKQLEAYEHKHKLCRHYQAFEKGMEDEDHLAAVAWRALMTIEKR